MTVEYPTFVSFDVTIVRIRQGKSLYDETRFITLLEKLNKIKNSMGSINLLTNITFPRHFPSMREFVLGQPLSRSESLNLEKRRKNNSK